MKPSYFSPFALVASFAFTLSMSASATQVYITIDENGNRVFSDQPSDKARTHKVKPIQTIPAIKVPAPEPEAEEPEAFAYESLTITSPTNDAVINRGQAGNFHVLANLTPTLQDGDEVVLTVNGKEINSGIHLSWQLTNVNRGTQTLVVIVRDRKTKETRIASAPVQVHVQRASVR